jgi:signal transduction histidine kinase
MVVRLGIKTKILVLIMAATIIPLLSLNVFWINSQRRSLLDGTRSRQALIAQTDAEKVNDFITIKLRTLIIHSQSPSLQQFNPAKASLEISTLLYQDSDLTRVAFVNQDGQEVLALTNDLKNSPLQNVKNSDAFKVVNYFAGNQYISPVSSDAKGHPIITIAVPLVTFTKPQDLGALSTAEPGLVRNPQDIRGALIAQVSLENLWNSVLSTANNENNTNTPSNGYAYVVDDKGAVIAHPDGALTNAHTDLSSTPIISLFKQSLGSSTSTPRSLQANSEKGVQVLATYQRVPSTDWGVMFEEPMSSIYKNLNRVLYLGLALSAAAIVILASLSLWLSRFLSQPILRIARVAERIGRGDFSEQLTLKRSDEIGALSDSINAMGANLQTFIGRIDTQRQQLEVILNSTTDGIMAIDSTGTVIIANKAAAQLCEYTNALPIGEKIQSLFPWMQGQGLEPFNIDYASHGTHTYYNLQYTSPSGVVHYVNLITVKAHGAAKTVQTIVTIHDETKSRELENMKVDFVSMAAHELRTPLSTVRGYLELLSFHSDGDANRMLRYATQARRSAEELASLISNLLDVSRIERGTLVLNMDKVDLVSTIRQSIQNLRFNAEAKQTTLTYNGADQGQYIIADAIAIQEVIDNLIDNAIKYTPMNGQVTVTLMKQGASHVIAVTDTGAGIPANALPYLFTKFYRVHGGLESGSTGTGLGLFISKSIIERHSGTITVASNEGKGSTFTVTLPEFSEEKFVDMRKTRGEENVSRRHGWTTKNITR